MDAQDSAEGSSGAAEVTKEARAEAGATSVFKTAKSTLRIAFHVAFRPYSSLLVLSRIDPVAVHVAVQNHEPASRPSVGWQRRHGQSGGA